MPKESYSKNELKSGFFGFLGGIITLSLFLVLNGDIKGVKGLKELLDTPNSKPVLTNDKNPPYFPPSECNENEILFNKNLTAIESNNIFLSILYERGRISKEEFDEYQNVIMELYEKNKKIKEDTTKSKDQRKKEMIGVYDQLQILHKTLEKMSNDGRYVTSA